MSMGKLASSWPGPWELESAVLGRISPISAPRDQQEMVLFLLSGAVAGDQKPELVPGPCFHGGPKSPCCDLILLGGNTDAVALRVPPCPGTWP